MNQFQLPMSLECIQEALADRNVKRVAANTGLAYNTVHHLAHGTPGKSGKFSVGTLTTISQYLLSRDVGQGGAD